MRVCVYGAGAVGGHLAGRLAEGGASVSLIARGPHLAAIKASGLRVETTGGTLLSRPAATDDPRDLGPQDIVIVTVKAPALPQVAESIAPLLHEDTVVIFAMNGIPWWYFHAHGGPFDGLKLSRLDPGDRVWTTIGPRRAVGAVAYTACTVTSPGVVHAENPRNRIVLGRPDGSADPRLAALGQMLSKAGIETETTLRIRDAIWSKLVMNLVGGSLAVITGFPMKDVLSSAIVADTAAKMAAEAMALAQALGCHPDDPAPALARLAASKHKQSILQDLEQGRSMEVDAMLNVPLELAELVCVETPTLALVVQLAVLRARSAGLYQG
jgi:2-dehydropantoate 2-reductase